MNATEQRLTSEASQEKWLPQLDGVRTVAVTLVFIHHWTTLGHSPGIVGVQLFFVLSGFLITGILLRERREIEKGCQTVGFSVKQFYTRRFLRIIPLYYFCLILFMIANRFGIRETFLWHLFYLSNALFFTKGEFSGLFSHFWSLSVEEQFYLFWPWVVLLTPRKHIKRVLLAMIVLAPVTRMATYLSGLENFAQTSIMVWANLDTLGMGALIACVKVDSEEKQRSVRRWLDWSIPFCGIEILAARLAPAWVLWVWLGPIAVAFTSAWVIWTASVGFKGIVGRCLSSPLMVYLGKISYGLYVWHMFAPAFVRNLLHLARLPESLDTGFVRFLLLYAWTAAAASLTWFALEKPINRLKRRFPYRKGQTSSTQLLVEVS